MPNKKNNNKQKRIKIEADGTIIAVLIFLAFIAFLTAINK